MSELKLNQFVNVAPLMDHASQAFAYLKIAEEASEVAQKATKIITYGVNCNNPAYEGGRSNINRLETEIGHLLAWIQICGELNEMDIQKSKLDKLDTYREWTCA